MATDHRLPNSLAGVGSTVGLVATYALPVNWNVGPRGRWWELVRRLGSRAAGVFDERLGPRPIAPGEYAGRIDQPPELVEQQLWERGFVRNPFSRLKELDGVPECGSWVYRESPLARRQLHLMLFRGDSVSTYVYAHEEESSVHPLVGEDHLDGETQNVAAGVERARELLDLEYDESAQSATDGDWTENL